MKFKNLEDKCQYYRSLTDYRILPNSNILVMLDGKKFSTLIKNNFKKPFDDTFIDMMNRTAQFLCNNVQGVKFAYTQSDEISLLITDYDTPNTDTPFGGRICKLQSLLASLATSEFNRWFTIWNLNKCKDNVDVGKFISKMKMAQFDCKVWTVPSLNDAYAWFHYRQIDCIRNSKQQTAQTYLPNTQLLNLDTDKQIEMCKNESGIDWNSFEDIYKYGRFVYKFPEHFSKTLSNGTNVEFERNKFKVVPAFLLSENKEQFFEIINNSIKNTDYEN